MEQYIVTGMTCAACQAHVEKAVSKLSNVDSVSVSLLTNSMAVEGSASCEEVIKAVEGAGYGAMVKGATKSQKTGKLEAEADALVDRETPKLAKRLAASVIWLLILMYITMGHNMLGFPIPAFLHGNFIGLAITQMLIAIIVMYINRAFFISGFKTLQKLSPNMDSLVALGSSVSFGWSLYVLYTMTIMVTNNESSDVLMNVYHNRLYFESAAMIPSLITVGKTLEAMSKGRTTDALKSLMNMAPKKAVVIRGDEQIEVDIDEVNAGDIFAVKPGESIPVDGVIIEGETAVDESALTGESIPVDKVVDDAVSAATINKSGYIKARATRVGEDTTFAQIIQMVSDAAATKAPIAKIADTISGVFVPGVITIAVVVAIVWLIAGRDIAYALEKAITVLVISCPCALGLATPVAIMVGNGMGAKNGILFKTSAVLEDTGRAQIVVLDKTGTITAGKPTVTDIYPAKGTTSEELVSVACSIEQKSEHPLAEALVKYAEDNHVKLYPVNAFAAIAGNGLTGEIEGSIVRAGSKKFIEKTSSFDEEIIRLEEELSGNGKTPMFFEKDGKLLGIIAVADTIKEDSAEAIKQFKKLGLKVFMLTGDNERTAKAIGDTAGVDNVVAGVLPSGKEAVVKALQKYGKVVMVGDGINDAPALTSADIGVAIGAGADVAIDSADVVLMNSKLTDVSAAIRLSKATLRNIKENLFWAFAYNAILIPIAAGLYRNIEINPMFGAGAMALSSFTVCMNALRLNLFKVHDSSKDRPVRNQVGEINPDDIYKNENTDEGGIKMTETVKIEGMMCPHCEATVKKALEALDGVESAEVSHEKGTAVLTMTQDVADDVVKKAVEDKDYKFIAIEK
ncbi:MAG: heavy metal translocating P-type ATPase [Lachnospiraceae bacterium]|nr:heavy metal translocating P-type ATPase [Lachnospiraceae bacterium]